MFNFKNKVAVVTGGSKGIGRAIALKLAENGCNVAIADIIDSNVVNVIKKLKRKALYVKTNTSDKRSVNYMVNETIKRFHKIDILVNNAGIFRNSPSENLSEEEWNKIIDVNLKGYFLCSQAVFKYIKKSRGNIVNISSVAGLKGSSNGLAYCCSKGGVVQLTRTLAAEWARYNIRVNAICPGIIETSMTKGLLADRQIRKSLLMKVPLGRIGKPDDIAFGVIYLASKEASYVNGNILVIDGGWICSL